MAVADRLELLRQLRDGLADNLTAMGIASERTETLEVLVPRVLEILNTTAEAFAAALKSEWDVSYGFFAAGETVDFAGMAAVTEAVRIRKLTYALTGSGLTALTASGDGWAVTAADDALTAVYGPGRVMSLPELQAALDNFRLDGDGQTEIRAGVTLTAESVSGAVYTADGTASFSYAYGMTWALLETVYPTWADINGKTWTEAETFSKS